MRVTIPVLVVNLIGIAAEMLDAVRRALETWL
jgi:hypothetical protein